MKESILQLLVIKFKNLKMEKNEIISQYHGKVHDIVNETFALAEAIPKKYRYTKCLGHYHQVRA